MLPLEGMVLLEEVANQAIWRCGGKTIYFDDFIEVIFCENMCFMVAVWSVFQEAMFGYENCTD